MGISLFYENTTTKRRRVRAHTWYTPAVKIKHIYIYILLYRLLYYSCLCCCCALIICMCMMHGVDFFLPPFIRWPSGSIPRSSPRDGAEKRRAHTPWWCIHCDILYLRRPLHAPIYGALSARAYTKWKTIFDIRVRFQTKTVTDHIPWYYIHTRYVDYLGQTEWSINVYICTTINTSCRSQLWH